MKYNSLLIVLLVAALSACSGTKSAGVAGSSSNQAAPSASSRSAGSESGSNSIFGGSGGSTKKGNSKAYQRTHADLVKEAEERQVENAKRREKEAKLAEKPQYSDPSYFGHKKKPKKRPVGKRKMCKECGIVH
ncbi:hypothetical protein [Cesiribacter sp. SM1]|uniref:hypothetical protein n=1 Tax=Cesiribacter sp. SM1 TaxID=2861196 RepID=UPI001CD79678|nr:hypothetical protein [Cesiribacter sp. SM1]